MIFFKVWRRFQAFKDKSRIKRFLERAATESERAFRKGLRGRHSGRIYRLSGGRMHRASAPGEYPANRSGALEKSIRTRVGATQMVIGTGVFYARFLRSGTRKMARRKMSDNALQEGTAKARPALNGYARWRRL